MTSTLWRPSEVRGADWQLVACAVSDRCLYVLVEGPFQVPTVPGASHPGPSHVIRVAAASGAELDFLSMNGHPIKKQATSLVGRFDLPSSDTDSLLVQVVNERESAVVYEVRAVPVAGYEV